VTCVLCFSNLTITWDLMGMAEEWDIGRAAKGTFRISLNDSSKKTHKGCV